MIKVLKKYLKIIINCSIVYIGLRINLNYKRRELMGKEKLDFLLAQNCAPTLAGLKAASMVDLGCTAIVSVL